MGKSSASVYHYGCVGETLKNYGLAALIASVILFTVPWFINYILLYYVVGVLFLISLIVPVVTKWRPKEKISPDGKAVFISGCDSGFGHLLAQRLDDLGFQVFAGCLFPDGDGALELRKSGSRRLHIVSLDVTSDNSVQEAATFVKENLKTNALWAVVNNAGINAGGELHWTDIETIKRVLEVNTFGVARVTKAFLSKLKESKGRIVTVASAAGRYTFPGMVPYCMSKCAAISFCDGLRLEMYKWDIPVITIEPWMYRTAIVDTEVIKNNLRQTWEKAPKEVKDMYNSNYLEPYIKRTLVVPKHYSKPNPSEVVSLLEDGITVLYPEYSYTAGDVVSRLSYWILQRLPKPVADLVMFYTLMK